MKKLLFIVLAFACVKLNAQNTITPDTISYPNDSTKNFNKALYSDSLASSFIIVIKKEVKLHKHVYHSEHVYFLEGEGEMVQGDKKFTVKKGDFVFIPKNTVHGLKVTSKIPVKLISVQSPYFDGTDRVFTE
jgi:mannose-6-phosphate isomerase-like protein (cupin superfamily)